MKRGLLIGGLLLAALALCLAGFVSWCLGTSAGARWLIDTAGSLSGTEIRTASIQGSLLDGLALKEVQVSWQGGAIEAGDVKLDIQHIRPLSRSLAVEELTIHRLVLYVEEGSGEPAAGEAADQHPGSVLAAVPDGPTITIDRLTVTDFLYRGSAEAEDRVVIADLIAGQYRLKGRRLEARGFAYHSPYVELDGDFDWELARPHLVMDAMVRLPATCVDPDLFATIKVPVAFPGHLELDGDWDGYSGPIRVGAPGQNQGGVWLAAQATGSWRGIHLSDLKGGYLDGAVNGDLDLAWIDSYRMHGTASAEGLNPAGLIEDMAGNASFDTSGELFVPYDDQPLQASLAVQLREGHLRGYPLHGRVAGQWTGMRLDRVDIDLSGDGAHLVGKGTPAERVEIDLDVADLGAFHQEAAGRAVAKGWVSWGAGGLAGEIDGRAESLAWRDTKVGRIEFHARHPVGEEAVSLSWAGEQLQHGSFSLQKAAGQLSGTLASHRLEVAADGAVGHFSILAAGSYQPDQWNGHLEKLTGEATPWGDWTMAKPTLVAWDRGVIRIDKLLLTAGIESRLEFDVRDWGSAERAEISLSWAGIALEWLQPYQEFVKLSGRSKGELHYSARSGQPFAITGKVAASGHAEDDLFSLDYRDLQVDFNWADKGLELAGTLTSSSGEQVRGRATSAEPLAWSWPIPDFEADLEWQQLDLSRLARVLKHGHVFDFTELSGESDGHLRYESSGGRPRTLIGQVTARGMARDEHFELAYETLTLDLSWNDQGLDLNGRIASAGGEVAEARVSATGPLRWQWPIANLTADLSWQQVDLVRFNQFLGDISLEGKSEGTIQLAYAAERLQHAEAHLAAQGRMMQGEQELGPRSLAADLNWEGANFLCTMDIAGARGGHATVRLTAPQPPGLSWPASGQITMEIKDLDLTAFGPLLPQDVQTVGLFAGQAQGSWQEGGHLELSGSMELQESHIGWSSEEGQIRLPLQDAVAEWNWRGQQLTGSFAMNLAGHGDLRGSWQLPLPARIPAAFEPQGQLQARLVGRMQAIGLLSSIGPWLVQDVKGDTRVDLSLQGTWADPDLRGEIMLRGGSAYLPAAGLQLENINILTELAEDRLAIEQLEIHSGPGILNGHGEINFDRFSPTRYQLELTGRNLQVVNFPELQVLCNPDLEISGTPERLAIQGSMLIPTMKIRESKSATAIRSSKDVVLETRKRERRELTFSTDILVAVELGDDITFKAEGVDTRLKGGAMVSMGHTGELLAHGEIQLASGTYRAHGVNLQIKQGILTYKGRVLTNPELRIFAAREVGTVLAGVQITGDAEAPVVSLWSRPAMPERDILGYMLMGRAIRTEDQETDMLVMGAGSLLGGGGSTLADLGITEIDIQGLFNGTGGVRLRRPITDRWEVESTLGQESGVDLYYIFEFD